MMSAPNADSGDCGYDEKRTVRVRRTSSFESHEGPGAYISASFWTNVNMESQVAVSRKHFWQV